MSIGRAIVAMAHGLGMKAIAEGVETTEQLCFYRSEGSQAAQGFLVSEPLPANEVEKFLPAFVFSTEHPFAVGVAQARVLGKPAAFLPHTQT